MDPINLAIFIAASLVVVSVFTSLVSLRVGVPLLLVFLGVGLLAGEDGIGGIDFDNAPAAFTIGSLALAVVLFDSGFETHLQSFRLAAAPALILATVGVALTTLMVGAAAAFLLDIGWLEGMLVGAIVSSTDAAAVFFLLRVGGIRLRDRVRSTLEIESGSNDPMAIFLTLTLVELVTVGIGDSPVWEALRLFALHIGIGGVLGLLGGEAMARIVNRLQLEAGLYPVLTIGMALTLFAGVNLLHGSGYLAVYVAGVVVGNRRLRAGQAIRRFQAGMTWLAQIVMFVTLGLLATPSQFGAVALPALALSVLLILVARPLAIWLCLWPFRFSHNEMAFVAWVGLRGAVSILLAIVPILGGVAEGQALFNTAFLVVVVSLVVQGWTIAPVARWLRLTVPATMGPVERVELDLPGQATYELVTYTVVEQSPVTRGATLPRWARPSLIVRDGRPLPLYRIRELRAGDRVYLFAPPRRVPLLDRLYAGTAPLSAEDEAFFGDFVLKPDVALGELAGLYGIAIGAEPPALTLAELFHREFGAALEVGDRLRIGQVELIARDVAEGAVEAVGLAVEPTPPVPQLPLFQKPHEIAAAIRARWAARRARRQAAE